MHLYIKILVCQNIIWQTNKINYKYIIIFITYLLNMRWTTKFWLISAWIAATGVAFEAARHFIPGFNEAITPYMHEVSTRVQFIVDWMWMANKVAWLLSFPASLYAAYAANRAMRASNQKIESGKFPNKLRFSLTRLNTDGTMAIDDVGEIDVTTVLEGEVALTSYRKAYDAAAWENGIISAWAHTRQLRRKWYVSLAPVLKAEANQMRMKGVYGLQETDDVKFIGVDVREPQFETNMQDGIFRGFTIVKEERGGNNKTTTIEQGRTMIIAEEYLHRYIDAIHHMSLESGKKIEQTLKIIANDIQGTSQELRALACIMTQSRSVEQAIQKLYRGDAKHMMRFVTHAQVLSTLILDKSGNWLSPEAIQDNIDNAVVHHDVAHR